MSETIEIHPVSASADGKRNAFCHQCAAVGQRMSYAACLNRLEAVKGSDAPSDWAACRSASRAGSCKAETMREEEVVAGKSIYFQARELVAAAADTVRKWFMPGDTKPARGSRGTASVTSNAGMASFADAINAAMASGAATAPAAPKPVAAPIVAQPGETPLQLARRLAAERKAKEEAAHV